MNTDGHVVVARCPKCGATPETGRLRYVETIECWRSVRGARDGAVETDGLYETGERYAVGRVPKFVCHGVNGQQRCGHRWAVSEVIRDAIGSV
jgi:hypothetical protein